MAKDPYQYFRIEARELVESMGRGVLQLEQAATPELTANLLRFAHTLKGAARVVRQNGIADDAHAIEDALGPLREPGATLGAERIDAVLKLLDAISARVRDLDVPAEPAATPASAMPPATAKPAAAKPATAKADKPALEELALRTVRADVAEMDALLDGVGETAVHLRGLRRAGASAARLRQLTDALAQRPADPTAATGDGAAWRALADEARALAATLEQRLTWGLDRAERQTQQVRDAAERLRLFPIRTAQGTLERAARDVAHAQGKQVLFTTKGADVRVDADVLAIVQGALVQMVRNAVAHGIETEDERRRAGKSPAGRVELEVVQRGGRVAFLCRDDGRGIDLAAVRRAAEARGALAPGIPATEEQLIGLLFKGGVSTAAAVTEHSGRGIGLDIVREAAERLGGEATARSGAGGTELELVVPVSRSALDALLVTVAGATVAIPFEAVRHTARQRRDDLVHAPQGEAVVYEGETIPFLPLAVPLGRPVTPAASWITVVVAAGEHLAAVGVDRMLAVGNVVVRALPPLAPAYPVVAGASLNDDGAPQLVLDPHGLVAAAREHRQRQPVVERPVPHILVIDDSLTTRMLEQSILESAGFRVDTATSAEEGLEKARRNSYHLFLVDVEMPGMDGFTFVETTRADPTLRAVPAILVTSRNAPADRQRGLDAGASDYVVKGQFDQVRLLTTIRKLVG